MMGMPRALPRGFGVYRLCSRAATTVLDALPTCGTLTIHSITNSPSLFNNLTCPQNLPHPPRIPTLWPFSTLPWKLTNGRPRQT